MVRKGKVGKASRLNRQTKGIKHARGSWGKGGFKKKEQCKEE
jgi:hypothetical protein